MSVDGSPPPDDQGDEHGEDGRFAAEDTASAAAQQDSRRAEQSEVDAAFAAMIAGWDTAAPAGPRPDDPTVAEPAAGDTAPAATAPDPAPATGPGTGPRDSTVADEDPDEGHYEPPEPPTIPRLPLPALGALLIIAGGIGLIAAPGVVGLGDGAGVPLGLLLCAGGLGWLLSRLRTSPGPDSGWDDGARL